MTVSDDAKPSSFAKSFNGPPLRPVPPLPKNVQRQLYRKQRSAVTLEEIDGVVSPRSFEAFLEWLYRGRVSSDPPEDAGDKITRVLEFCRIVDMFDVHGMEEDISVSLRPRLGQKTGLIFLSRNTSSQPASYPRG
ncbi:hypothetical protein N7478_006169 [Penicillium angulare]|uniref:uncharacterized protein n=1 Tax=Penicillium angulare TaxID=116970 RepID=UPI002540F175|nr:uncharacterized protein N7478_006169 [Penicillium angulare]KAJ5280797.1 hypothetical protein N7478_006169 [Penicillium angulare]